jgi:NAD(P)-dependent dehydrogenase (short-subunit alcohol dehydrogenase family)
VTYHNKIILVTGGGSGIGRAVAQGFAERGGTVVVSGRNREPLEQTVELIEDAGGQGAASTADVTSSADLARLVGGIVDRYGRLDVAVNNAGVLAAGLTTDLAESQWSHVLDVNATGVFLCMQHEIAAMRGGGGGAIVNISSNIGAHTRIPGLGAYAASKAAVTALSRTAALEYIQEGIRVNVVSPGASDTTMSLLPGETDADRAARLGSEIPIGRVGALEEITSAVVWLASAEASYLVGHDLVIDGGASA